MEQFWQCIEACIPFAWTPHPYIWGFFVASIFLFAFRPPVKSCNLAKEADVDNLTKFVSDALQGTIYNDNREITTHDGAKKCFYLGCGGNAYIVLF